jgi:hypothetical protein
MPKIDDVTDGNSCTPMVIYTLKRDGDTNQVQVTTWGSAVYEPERATPNKKIIWRFPHQHGKRRRGILLAVIEHDRINFGWSLCKKTDKYDFKIGYDMALKRATRQNALVPTSMQETFADFVHYMVDRHPEKSIEGV